MPGRFMFFSSNFHRVTYAARNSSGISRRFLQQLLNVKIPFVFGNAGSAYGFVECQPQIFHGAGYDHDAPSYQSFVISFLEAFAADIFYRLTPLTHSHILKSEAA